MWVPASIDTLLGPEATHVVCGLGAGAARGRHTARIVVRVGGVGCGWLVVWCLRTVQWLRASFCGVKLLRACGECLGIRSR
jgi:hypothetical protein